jgi:hypothetical protein
MAISGVKEFYDTFVLTGYVYTFVFLLSITMLTLLTMLYNVRLMTKTKNIGVRLNSNAAEALQKAAASDKRTVSWLAALFIEEALRKAGWLP